MKSDISLYRYNTLVIALLGYLAPIIALCAYATLFSQIDSEYNWYVLCLGLLTAILGSLAIFFRMTKWQGMLATANPSESLMSENLPSQSYEESFTQVDNQAKLLAAEQSLTSAIEEKEKLKSEMAELLEKFQKSSLHSQDEQHTWDKKFETLSSEHQSLYQQMEQQQIHIRELQEFIADQKLLLEKKQQQVGMLETKVGDMTYEIKTLLQLAESHNDMLFFEPEEKKSQEKFSPKSPSFEEDYYDVHTEKVIQTHEEASRLLKRCLDIAQKITGSHRFNSQPNAFLDSPADSFALDLRRLCDRLRSESAGAILLYSPKESQVLFANNQIKTLTGWSSDKFVQNFAEILHGEQVWKQGIASLAIKSETQIKLSIKAKTGQEVALDGYLGMIPTGIFRQHAIAILYLPESN